MNIGDGYRFSLGAFLFVAILSILSICLEWTGWRIGPYDDSDNGNVHSKMNVRSDHLTGCEYLETWTGQITPRMGRDGKQVCR